MIGNSNDETNFSHKLLLNNTQASRLREAFANNSSANITISKTELSEKVQSAGFLVGPREPLLKTGSALTKNVFKPLAKSVLVTLGLTAAASATDVAIP